MKQKLFFLITSTFLILNISSQAFSLDLEKELNKVVKKVTGNSDSNDKIERTINEIKDEVIGKVDEEINAIKAKIAEEEAKVRAIITEVEDGINKFRDIKTKTEKYMGMVKIIIALLSIGVILIAFFLWRVWRNVTGLKKTIKNITNYDAIRNQIEDLENKVAQLEGQKVAAEVKNDNITTA